MMLGISIDKDEATQITISVLAISLAMALVFATLDGMLSSPFEFLRFIPGILVTVGSGFILHEMAHKLVAMYYGAQARFQMWTSGLIFMLVTSLFGVLFAAPGAVYIYAPRITTRQNGLISIAGPLLNFVLAIVFIGLQYIAPINQFFSFLVPSGTDYAGYGILNGMFQVWHFGAAINIMLGVFNMIPVLVLDGAKIFRWSKMAWGGLLLLFMGLGTVVIGLGFIFGWIFMALILFLLAAVLWVLSRFIFG